MNNPILWLELRTRIRERKLWIVTCIYLLCLFAIAFISITVAAENPKGDPADVGMAIFGCSAFSLLALLVILGPLASAGAITQEREQRTLPALLNTPLSPSTIVWGKLLASWVFILWLAALSLPFLILGVIWGGVDIWKFIAALGVDVLAGMVSATIAIGLSGYFRRSLTSYLGTGAVMFLWLVVWPIFGGLTESLTRSNQPGGDPVVFYVFFAHHLAAPLICLMLPASGNLYPPSTIIPFALIVWAILGAIFFGMACRGVTRTAVGKN